MVTLLALFGVLATASVAAVVSLSRHRTAAQAPYDRPSYDRASYDPASYDPAGHEAQS